MRKPDSKLDSVDITPENQNFVKTDFITGADLQSSIDAANADARIAESKKRISQPVDDSDIPESSADYVAKSDREEKQRNIADNDLLFNLGLEILGGTEPVTKKSTDNKPQRETFGSMMSDLMSDMLGGGSDKPAKKSAPSPETKSANKPVTKPTDEKKPAQAEHTPKSQSEMKSAPSPETKSAVNPVTAKKEEPVTKPTDTKKDAQPETSPPKADESLDDYHKQIAADIERAKRQMFDLPGADNRCLSDETRASLGIYFLPKFRHPKFPKSSPSPRFIIQLGDKDDLPAYNAVLTPSGRKRFKGIDPKKDKAAEKTLTAGDKLLFNPDALKAYIFFVTEGEIDAASIWQATYKATKRRIQACALGGAGIFGDLLRRVAKLEVKPRIIILFDKDEESKTGQTNAKKLQKKLADIGIVGLPIFLDDFITKNQREKLGDHKADPNEILQRFGDVALNALITKIFEHTEKDFWQAEAELKQLYLSQQALPDAGADLKPLHMRQNSTVTSANSDTTLSDSPEYDIFRATLMLDKIAPADLDYYNWLAVISSCKNIGVDYPLVDAFNRRDSKRYDAGANQAAWNAGSDSSFDIKTLHGIAQSFGYSEADARRQWFELHPELKPKPAETVQIPDDMREELAIFKDKFGDIDPKVLPKLEAAKNFIDGLTPQNFKAAFAYEPAPRNKIALCKFYLPSIAQKFFDTLKAARKLSRDILKQISRETAALEKAGEPIPTVDFDEISRLADIAPSKIALEIDEAVTSLKNKQRTFAKHRHEKRSEMAKNAATDAQNAFSSWTLNLIKDCPINLFVPDTVYFSTSGVGTQRANKLGDLEIYPATKSPIIPTKIFRTPKSHATKYEIAVKTRRRWRHIIVDGDELADPKKILRLAKDGGALIKNAKNLTGFFAEIIAANEDRLPEIACYTRPGWYDGKFIYPTPADGDNYIVQRSGINYQEIFKARGDKDAWLSKFLEVISGEQGALKRIVIGACLVAPTLGVIKIPNPQFNIWGTSNYAKTPLPKFGLSIYGDPTEGKLFRTWASTPKNMLAIAAGFNGLPLLVDEGETMTKWNQANLSAFVYDYQAGIVNQANKRNGDVRESENFRGVRISTAEHPFHTENDKQGNFKRLIDLHVTKELFDDDYARDLHLFCEDNHGHFGRQWTNYIAEHKDELAHDFKLANEYFAATGFVRDGVHAELKSVDATNARAVIACAVAVYHFCKCLGVTDLPHAYADAAEILAQLPTVKEINDVQRSIDLLASWVVENPTRFITPQKTQNGEPIDNADNPAASYAGTVGKKFADGRIAFFPNAFRKICVEIGIPSYEKLLSDLYDADFLDCPSRREKCRKIRIDKDTTRAYVLKSGVLKPKQETEDE